MLKNISFLTKILTALPHHLHCLLDPAIMLVIVVEAAKEQAVKAHLCEEAGLEWREK